MTSAVVFDLDGTLVDTPRAIGAAFAAAFAELGVPAVDPAAVRATVGLPLERAFGILLAVPPADPLVVECVRLYQRLYRELVVPRAPELLFPGVVEGLAALRGDGLTLAVATSKFHASADALLTAAGLSEMFGVVVGADEVTNPKPDPEMARLVLRSLDIAAEQAVVVGDTTHDLRMARSAGMRSVAVTYGVHGRSELATVAPTYYADTFDEVVRCVRSWATGDRPGPARPTREEYSTS